MIIHMDPGLYVPQGATAEERAEDKARIIARLQRFCDEQNQAGYGTFVVGFPEHMGPAAAWMCGPGCQDAAHLGSPDRSGFASHATGAWAG